MPISRHLSREERELLKRNRLFLQGEVDERMFRHVQAALSVLESRNSPPIIVRISSMGGISHAGLVIGQLFSEYQGKVTAEVVGCVASAAVHILLHCDERRCKSNAILKPHLGTVSWVDIPIHKLRRKEYLEKRRQEALHHKKMVIRLYCKMTGLPWQTMYKLLAKDEALDAKTAKRLGFIDSIFA